MDPASFLQIALVSTSLTIALVLAIAWHEFGRPRHALTWSIGFALAAIMWTMNPVPLSWVGTTHPLDALSYALAAVAMALNTLAFRQRTGANEQRSRLLASAVALSLLVLLLIQFRVPKVVELLPINLFDTAMFYLAARTLRGRRKGERAAERVAESGLLLLALCSAAVSVGLGAAALGFADLDARQLGTTASLFVPGIIAGIGLFTIILMVADLADQGRRLAVTDLLTGLLNRRGFEDAARTLIESARRFKRAMTLVLIDLDHFKDINDRFGHPTGDRVLCAVCTGLTEGISRRDVLARFGGEEFALILVDADIVTATITVESLRRAVASLDLALPQAQQVTASFGVAALHEEEDGFASVLKRADAALYRSKAEGRNRVTVA